MSGDRYKIADQHAVYFLTFTVVEWIDIFSRKEYKYIIVDALNYCISNKGLNVYAWVLMSNHLHLIAKAQENHSLSDIIRDFKKFTSKEIVRTIKEIPESRRDWLLDKFSFEARKTKRAKNYKLWKDDNHAVLLATTEMLLQRINYIHQNPIRQIIVEHPEDFLFSSAVDFAGKKGMVNIVCDNE
jgi:putative transposase